MRGTWGRSHGFGDCFRPKSRRSRFWSKLDALGQFWSRTSRFWSKMVKNGHFSNFGDLPKLVASLNFFLKKLKKLKNLVKSQISNFWFPTWEPKIFWTKLDATTLIFFAKAKNWVPNSPFGRKIEFIFRCYSANHRFAIFVSLHGRRKFFKLQIGNLMIWGIFADLRKS